MSSRLRGCRRLLVVALATLAGCAEVPPQPSAPVFFAPKPSAHEERVRQAVARHQQLARGSRQWHPMG
jgi:hypothetical protein